MSERTTHIQTKRSYWQTLKSALACFCTALPLMILTSADALAAPAAGSVIGNQASATYLDGSGQSRNATSNLVETLVAQVGGVDIESDLSKTASPGGTVNYPHIITNTGNGVDTFDLTLVDANTGNIVLGSLLIYADANQDGIPDNFSPITVTPGMNPGDTYGVVVATTVPGSVVDGDSETMTVTATSQFDNGVSDANTDTVTVTGNAIINVTKAINVSSGPSPNGNPADPDDPITITLTYTNSGIGTATAVVLTDTLPAGMTYVAGSGLWNGLTLVDATGANDPAGIDYDGGDTTADEIIATIASVPQGQSGTVSFEITIDSSLPPGALDNIATYSYDDGTGVIPPVNTNTASYTVLTAVAVDFTDTGSNTDDDANNDVVLISGPVAQGSILLFDNVLINNGNGSDTFDIALSGSTYPAATTFQLFLGDASGNPVSPMTDSNANGIPDTGPLVSGASYHVVLQATLPTNVSGGPFTVTKTATSDADPGISDPVSDTVSTVQAMSVDMTNNSGTVDVPGTIGTGAGPEVTPITTVSVDPGSTATFTLLIENEGTLISDTYDLDASTDPTFATVSLPAGWSVVFRDATSTIITSLVVPASTTTTITAEVSVPASDLPSPAPGTSIYFRAASSTSGASDIKHDAVIVNTIHDLAVASDSTGQVFPGGVIEYPFTLTNDGNIAETTASLSSVNGNVLWISAPLIYHDRNGNGVIDPGEPVVTDLADILADGGAAGGASTDLDPSESVDLVSRVEAPAGASAGDTNDTTVTVVLALDSDPANDTLTNISTVISGDVTVVKEQGLDVDCDGGLGQAGDIAFTTSQINSAAAAPGACVLYRITATNTGSTLVTTLVVTDNTPSFTTYGCDTVSPQVVNNCAASGTGIVTTPALGASGVITDTVGSLAPTVSSVLTFGVKINP